MPDTRTLHFLRHPNNIIMSIQSNLDSIYKKVSEAAASANRNADEITLIAVTKLHGTDEVNELLGCTFGGKPISDIGENRVQEGKDKFPSLNRQVKKHLIGRLQTNKINQAIELFDCIHSIDSLELAQAVDKRLAAKNTTKEVLFQLNISGEESKTGMDVDAFFTITDELKQLKNIKPIGLMTMAPLDAADDELHQIFREMRKARDKAKNIFGGNLKHLSMGMSRDYHIAIQEGATMIRVGSSIFE